MFLVKWHKTHTPEWNEIQNRIVKHCDAKSPKKKVLGFALTMVWPKMYYYIFVTLYPKLQNLSLIGQGYKKKKGQIVIKSMSN